MLGAALLGAVMSSTAIVAIFIPIVLRIAAETNLNASRMLMPMSYAALISGMLTLIATTPNIVVHEELKEAGFSGFGFFSFAPVGLAVLVVAIIYILFIGRKMLSGDTDTSGADHRARSIDDLWHEFRLGEEYSNLRIENHSPLAGKSIATSLLESRYRVRILGILRRPSTGEERISAPAAYSTPVSTPVVTLVVDPGRYKFTDFVKVGLPLLLLTYVVTLFIAPLVFPFHAF